MTTFTYYNNLHCNVYCIVSTAVHLNTLKEQIIIPAASLLAAMAIITIYIKQWRIMFKALQRDV